MGPLAQVPRHVVRRAPKVAGGKMSAASPSPPAQRMNSTCASNDDHAPVLQRGVCFTFPESRMGGRYFSATAGTPPNSTGAITVGEVVKADRLRRARSHGACHDSTLHSSSSQFTFPVDPRGLFHVDRDTPLGVTVASMVQDNVASVLVTAPGGSFRSKGIRGIFSERDYLYKVALTDENPKFLTVGDVMSTDVTCVTEDMDLDQCLSVMAEQRIRRVPVLRKGSLTSRAAVRTVDMDGIVGILTSSLLIRTLVQVYRGHLCSVTEQDSAVAQVRTQRVGDLLHQRNRHPEMAGDEDFVREKHTISAHADTLEMCQKMQRSNVGSLAVMDGDKVIGVVSEREYMREIAAKPYTGKGFAHQVVDIMRPAETVTFITGDATVEDAMLAMADHPKYLSTHRHLPVLSAAGGDMVGMLSIRDIKSAIATAAQAEGDAVFQALHQDWRSTQMFA